MSDWPISIKYVGKPQGKGRARVKTFKGKTWGYTPPKTATYEEDLKWLAKAAMIGRKPLTGPVRMDFEFGFKAKGSTYHVTKPDFDNIMKSVADSLNEIVYVDDGQVCTGSFSKLISSDNYIKVTIEPA